MVSDTSGDWLRGSRASLTLGSIKTLISPLPIEAVFSHASLDAVVSSDDTMLSMSGGVSKAILEMVGPQLKAATQQIAPVRLGDVAVTPTNSLIVRYVLHAATIDLTRNVRPTIQTIRTIARGVFGRCEEFGIRRVVLPAVGAGFAAFPPDAVVRVLINALADHAENPGVLSEVVFSVPDDRAYDELTRLLEQRERREQAARGVHTADPIQDSAPPRSGSHVGTAQRGGWWSRLRKGASSPSGLDLRSDQAAAPEPARVTEPLPERSGLEGVSAITTHTVATAPTRAGARSAALSLAGPSRPLISGRYVLLEEIGRGGMGIVYLSWDVILRNVVAIKTLREQGIATREKMERLKREAALQMPLVHDGIVRLFHFEPWERSVGPYLLMEYVPWRSGDSWIAEAGSAGLPTQTVIGIGLGLCDALNCAHEAGVLHGDLKPSNVFIDPSGERTKLADFGIASTLEPKRNDAFVTMLLGTPDYMAPEQRTRGAKIGPWTDVFLLGVTLWEFLTGERPNRQAANDPSEPVFDVLRKALDERPDRRPQSVRAFRSLLAGLN